MSNQHSPQHGDTTRDRIRTSVEDRRRYEDLKRRLASRSWKDMNEYAEAKTEIIESILEAAMQEGAVSVRMKDEP